MRHAYARAVLPARGVAEPTVLKAFFASIEPWDPGSLARLSHGRAGRIRERTADVEEPDVEILWDGDGDGEVLPPSLIALADHRDLTVSAIIFVDDPFQPPPLHDEGWVGRMVGASEREPKDDAGDPEVIVRRRAGMATRMGSPRRHAS